jgi:O-antigen/teichoic acid export membrane protein
MATPKKNFIYNMIYHIFTLIIPLITAPYLSRVVGAKGVGIYSYTYSIVYYFMLLTLLGLNNYGNRSIAKVRDDKEKLSKTFWSIYLFQLIMGITMLLLYIGYILVFDNQYKLYASIEVLFIISAMLDINWFFFGMEEFKKTITRNTFVKVGNVILIFLLVTSQNDLWKYTLIMAGMTCLSQILLWSFLRKKISFVKINLNDIKKHIKPNLVLFIPVIAISLYKIMDKIMLGGLSNVTEVGYYENAEKIIGIPMTLITALGTVMLPRISNILSKGENKKVEEYISKSVKFIMFMSFAMCCGLIAIGYNFAPFFFGKEFQKTGTLIMMLAATLPFLSFANVLRTQYLIPKEKDKIYIVSVSLGAITNLIMNLVFIPKLASIGACIGTITAEFAVMFYQAMAIRKELPIKEYAIKSIPYLIKALIMLAIIYPLNCIHMSNILRLIIQVGVGCLVYGLLNIKYILSIVDIKKIFRKLRKN